jgi:hypothetical protein
MKFDKEVEKMTTTNALYKQKTLAHLSIAHDR